MNGWYMKEAPVKQLCKRMVLKALHVITVTLLLVQQTPATIAGNSDPYGAKPAQALESNNLVSLTPLGPPAAPAASQALGTCAQTLTAGTGRISGRSQLIGEVLDAGSGLSVYPGSGAVIYDGIDLSIHNQGPALRAALSYDSLYCQDDTGWGYGWTFNFDWHYEVEEDGVVLWLERSGLFFEDDGLGGFISPSQYITMTRQGDSLIVDWSSDKRLTFDSPVHKRITRWEEGEGSALTFAYDGDGQLQRIQSESGRRIDVAFQDDRLHTLTDEGVTPARWLQLDYDAAGDLVTVTHTLDRVTQLRYDADHRLVGLTDPQGTETVFTYDGDYVTQFARGDVTTRWTTDEEAGTVTVEEQAPGQAPRQWVYTYDYLGMLESTTHPDGSATRQVWDEVQNEWRTTDENGHTSTIVMADDRLAARRDPLGHTTTYTYHPTTGYMSGMTAPLGHTIGYEYDGEGRLTAMVDPQGGRWSYEYGSTGRVTRITDPLSRTTDMGYDDSGHLVVMTDSLGIPTHMAYDPAGRLVATTDGNGHTVRMDYDGLDRPVVITDALGYATTLAYDGGDEPTRVTDPNGNSTRIAYDELGQARVVTDALGNTLQMGYDAWGNLAALTDERGYTTSYQYDTRDRLIAQTDPLSQTTHYRYDGVGNRIGTTDARGRVITYTYDAADRLTAVDYASSDDDAYTFYDPAGQVTAVGDANVEMQYDYDAAGRIVTASYVYDGAPFAPLNVTHGYNPAGQVTTSTLPGGETVTYAYDGAARLAEVRGHGARHALAYDDGGRLTQVAPPAGSPGARTTYGYDAADQITILNNTNPDGSDVFDTFSYEYGPAGNVLTATRNGEAIGYDYDGVYRLTGVNYAGGDWERYTYDPAGNRLALETPGGTTQYGYDAANQLVALTDTLGVVTTFAYDANGNLTHRTRQGESIAYTWDGANRLVRIDYPDGTFIAYTYGPDGRRLSRRGRSGDLTYYVYDGLNLVEERDAAGNVLASYVYGQGLDRPYSMWRGGQVYYFLYDRQSSVVGLTDGVGTLVARYAYDAWGNLLSESGTVENPFRYTGREWDAEAGLYYLRARYYAPTLGRFLSRDPLGMVDGMNVYVYTQNNPVNHLDPLGTNSGCNRCDCFNQCFREDAFVFFTESMSWLVFIYDLVGVVREFGFHNLITFIMDSLERLNAYLEYPYVKSDCWTATKDILITILATYSTLRTECLAAIAAAGLGGIPGLVGAVAVIGFLSAQVTVTLSQLGGCVLLATLNCTDYISPEITVSQEPQCSGGKENYVITVSDSCGVQEIEFSEWGEKSLMEFTPPRSSHSFNIIPDFADTLIRAMDEEGNNAYKLVPACNKDSGCYSKPDCTCGGNYPNREAKWWQQTCSWECEDRQKPSLKRPCGCGTVPVWKPLTSTLAITATSVMTTCGEWECVEDPTWTITDTVQLKPTCGRDRCGYQLVPQFDKRSCSWRCVSPVPNNPCLPDDNRSPADPERSTAASSLLTSASHIAILDNGFAISMQNFLARQSIATKRVAADFSPEMVDRYPVLLIPSGGLNGYTGSESMRLRLARYVENGGTLIVFAQVHGDEFGLLPGGNAGVRGYGWDEDVNCQSDSAYVSTFHPALAGQYRDLLSLNIDGFFTHWPPDAEVLLGRAANGMPAMLTYPHGTGRVIVTTAYADMAYYQGQGTGEEAILLRDLLSWAATPELDFDSYDPGDSVTVALTVTNRTTATLTGLRHYFFSPQGPPATEPGVITLTVPLLPGASTPVSFTLDLSTLALPQAQRYGLWSVDVDLLDETGVVAQQELRTYRFAVTRFTQQPGGGHGYQGKPYAVSVTSASESYFYGSSATFTYNVFNHSDYEESFRLTWWFPHHEYFRQRYIPGSLGETTITVPSHGMASVSSKLAKIVDLDRIRVRLYLGDQQVAYAERGFWVVPIKVSQTLTTDQQTYRWGDRPVVTVTLTSEHSTPLSVTAHLAVQKPGGGTSLLDTRAFTVSLESPYVYTMTLLPLNASDYATGYNHLLLESKVRTHSDDATAKTSTDIYLPPRLANAQVDLPDTLEAGAPLTVTIVNVSDGVIPAPTVTLDFSNPADELLWSDQQTLLALNPGQTAVRTFTLGSIGPIVLGDYGLACSVADSGLTVERVDLTLPAYPSLEVHLDQEVYRVRETVQVTATARNQGHFDLAPTLQVIVPAIGYSTTHTLSLPVEAEATVPVTFTLPITSTAGNHVVQIAARQGNEVAKQYSFYQPPPMIDALVSQGMYIVGQSLPVTLTNSGGEDTLISYTLRLRDVYNNKFVLAEASDVSIPVGQAHVIGSNLSVLLASGEYRLELAGRYGSGDLPLDETWWVEIRGFDVQAQFGGEVYAAGDVLPVSLVNRGVVTATVIYTLTLHDRDGTFVIGQDPGDVSVPAGNTVIITGTVPQEIRTGEYVLVLDGVSGNQPVRLIRPLQIDGVSVDLTVHTDRERYLTSDTITTTAHLTSTGTALSQGMLDLSIGRERIVEAGIAHDSYPAASGGLRGDDPTAVYADGDGRIWIGSKEGYGTTLYLDLLLADLITWQTLTLPVGLDSPTTIQHITRDAQGRTWVATDGGVAMLAADEVTWTVLRADNSGLPSNQVRTLAADAEGNVWFGTDSGAAQLTPASEWITYTTSSSGLLHNQVNAIVTDHAGNVWFGTNGGLSRLTPASAWIGYTTATSGLQNNYVRDVAVDANGDVWLATDGGVNVRRAVGEWQTFTESDSDLSSDYATTIVIDDVGRKWIGHGCYGLPLDVLSDDDTSWETAPGLGGFCLQDLSTTPSGDVWAAIGSDYSNGGMVRYFRTPWYSQKYQEDTVFFHSDVDLLGNVWFVAEYTLERLSPDLVTWQSFALPGSMGGGDVTDIFCDEQGQTWITSEYAGVAVLKTDETWTIYDTGNSDLLSDQVQAVAGDGDGNVWFATAQGISKLAPTGAWVSYTTGNSDLPYPYIHDLDVDASGNVWGVTGNDAWTFGKLGELTPAGTWISHTLPAAEIRGLALDNEGSPWLASDAGVYALHAGTWTQYTTANSELRSNSVGVVSVAPDGSKWIGYAGWYPAYEEQGISILPVDGGDWLHFYPTDEGWGEVYVTDISFSPAGDAWVTMYWYYGGGGNAAEVPHKSGGHLKVADRTRGLAPDDNPLYAPEAHGVTLVGITHFYQDWRLYQDILWTRTVTTSLGSPDVFVDTASLDAASLEATGRLVLRGTLTSTGQLVAKDAQPFYVLDSDIRLTLGTDREAYYPGQTLLAQGALVNESVLPLQSQGITLTLGARVVHTTTIPTLDAGEAYTFSVPATLPARPGYVPLTVHSPLAEAQVGVSVTAPPIDVSLDAPAAVGQEPFSATLTLTNTSPVAALVRASIAGSAPEWVALPPGGFAEVRRTLEITQTTLITASVQGDLEKTLARLVTWGESLSVEVDAPSDPSSTGPLAIPYVITNTGAVAFEVPLTITLDGVELVADTELLYPGQRWGDELHVDVASGFHVLMVATPYAQQSASWVAYPPGYSSIRLDALWMTGRLAGRMPITVTLTNPGPESVSGSLIARMPFYLTEVPVDIAAGETQVVTATLDSRGAPAGGTYTVTVQAWAHGAPRDQLEQIVYVPPTEWQVDVPDLTLTPGVVYTVPLTIGNVGGIGEPYTLTFELDGLFSRQTYGWLDPGQEEVVSQTLALPVDLEARTGVGHYTINGAQTFFTYTIAGYHLDMSASLWPRVAMPGETVTATLLVTDTSGLGTPLPLSVRLGGVGEPQTTPITLTNALAVSFVITAPVQDALLSYGIYHPQGRSLLLDTMRLYVQDDVLRVYPNRDRYTAGDTLVLTAIADVPGTIVWRTLGVSQTLVLSSGIPSHWASLLPDDTLAGTTYADYYFERSDDADAWIAGQVAFDVEGERVEIHRILAPRQVTDRQIISPTLQIRSHTSLDGVVISGAVVGPDGTVMDTATTMVDMTAGSQWVELPALTFTPTYAGPHRVECRLSQGGRELAFGWEGFDVAGPTILGIHTSQAYYLPGQPITATVASSHQGDLPATLQVELDGTIVEQAPLAESGYHVTTVDLGTLAEGVYTLTARLDDGGGLPGELSTHVRVVSPKVQIDVSPPDGLGDWHTTTPAVRLWTDFSDGVIVYQWDEHVPQQLSDVWVNVPEVDGQHELAAWVEIPGVGAAPAVSATVWLDRAAPVVTPSVEMGTPVTLALSAADDASGVSWIRYQTGASGWLTYTSPIAFTEAQTTTVFYQARDQAGNYSFVDQVGVPPLSHPYGLVLDTETTLQDGAPGGSAVYVLSVINAGHVADRYTVTVTGGDWPVRSVDIVGPLDKGQSASLVVVADVPPDAALGSSDVAWVTVTSLGDPAQVETRQLTTTASVSAGVSVTAGRLQRTGSPGGRVSYRLRVTNQGNVADTFDLDLSQHAWPVTASLTGGPLAAGKSADLDVIVTVPDGAAPDEADTVAVSAVSHVDPAQSASVELITTISCVPASSISFTYWPSEPQAEETVYFTATTVAGTLPVDYAWHFGDGQTSTGQLVSHTYAVTGSYQVTVVATNCGGACVTMHTATLLVVGGGQPLRHHIYVPVVLRAWRPEG
jgi:RHS repeat-associated protein